MNDVALTIALSNQFNFRKTKSGFTRPSLSLDFPVATLAGLVALATNGSDKGKEYLLELTSSAVISHIKGLVDADLEFSQEKLDAILAKNAIDLEYLANLPRSERSGATKDDIDNFADAYRKIMASVTGLDQQKVDTAADIFQQRLKPVLAKPKMLTKMQAYLLSFAEAINSSEDAEIIEEHRKAIEWFTAKFAELLAVNLDEDAI